MLTRATIGEVRVTIECIRNDRHCVSWGWHIDGEPMSLHSGFPTSAMAYADAQSVIGPSARICRHSEEAGT